MLLLYNDKGEIATRKIKSQRGRFNINEINANIMSHKAKKLPASTNGFSEKQKEIFKAATDKATEDGYNGIDAILIGISEANKHKEVKKSVVEVLADKLAVLLTSTFGLDGSSLKETQPIVEVTKAVDVEQRRAMFVVLAPNEIDEHGDTSTEECVEKACSSNSSVSYFYISIT